mgnify:CR=1 FL=1
MQIYEKMSQTPKKVRTAVSLGLRKQWVNTEGKLRVGTFIWELVHAPEENRFRKTPLEMELVHSNETGNVYQFLTLC